jgi:hypothetical protein
MECARIIPISDESILPELSDFTFQYGERYRAIQGHYQLLREAEDTIVGLLHLAPSCSAKFAAFRKVLHRTSEA